MSTRTGRGCRRWSGTRSLRRRRRRGRCRLAFRGLALGRLTSRSGGRSRRFRRGGSAFVGVLGLRLGRRVEVGIPASTFQNEVRASADEPVCRGLGTLGTKVDGSLGNSLNLLPLVATRRACVLISRHDKNRYDRFGTLSSGVPDPPSRAPSDPPYPPYGNSPHRKRESCGKPCHRGPTPRRPLGPFSLN
jgi:hypothetical protein